MKRLVIFTTVLANLAGAGVAYSEPPTVLQPTSGKPKARIVLLHGLNADRTIWQTLGGWKTLTDDLRASGWQVVLNEEPYDGDTEVVTLARVLKADPSGYLPVWHGAVVALLNWLDHRYGRLPTVFAGTSWGGYNSLAAACADRRVSGYAVISPVINPGWLSQYFPGVDPQPLSLDGCLQKLAGLPGLIEYGAQDVTVGAATIAAFADQVQTAGGHPRVLMYAAKGHTMDDEIAAAVTTWLNDHSWRRSHR